MVDLVGLMKWLLTLNPADVTLSGVLLVEAVVAGVLLQREIIVTGARYRQVVEERDQLRESGDKCAASQEATRDTTMQLRLDLQQARFERDWYLKQQERAQ